jgi:inositol-hexakisphosphate kinase
VTPATHDCSNGDGDGQQRPEQGLPVHPQRELEHERHQRTPSDDNDVSRAVVEQLPSRSSSKPVLNAPLRRATTTPLEQLRPVSSSSSTFRSQSPQLSERDSIFATHYLPSDSNDASNTTPPLPPVRDADRTRRIGLISSLRDASASSVSAAALRPNTSRSSSISSSLAAAVDDPLHHRQNPAPRSGVVRRASEVLLSSPTAPLAGSHVGWVRQQETVESSKVAGKHRIAIRETFHPLRKIVSEGTSDEDLVSKDSDRSLLPFASDDPPRLDHIPMVRPSFADHEIAIAEPWAATRHHRHRDGTVDVTWDAKLNRSSSRGRSTRVEESIEANLANAEPAAHVRSRKSSHYLGLFKENTSPERKRREDRGRELDSEEGTRDLEDQPLYEEGDLELQHTPRPSHATLDVLSLREPTERQRPSEISKRRSEAKQPSSSAAQETSNLEPAEHLHKADAPRHPSRSLPGSLLEEIRNFHLTSGGARGGSFSQSIPTQYAERARDDFEESGDYVTQSLQVDDFPSRGEDTVAEEDEDEHISSALYFPHEPTTTEDVVSFAPYAHEREDYTLNKTQLEIAEPEIGGHVDISLRSRHDRSILHGDFQPVSDAEDKSLATISEYSHTSASESEALSADESALSTQEEESSLTDDADLTPTATPAQRQRYIRPRRKHAQTGPIGAVELKPYRHQVGGHTTVFRFSRRAVCKQLNNRENEFYERIERRHPEMLMFLPRLAPLFFILLAAKQIVSRVSPL